MRSPPDAKVKVFRRLFRGREDVYARRFESKRTGATGYSPACGNEWVRGVCEKPKVKCSVCPNRHLLPVTDRVITAHLRGELTMGVYPMLVDETCYFLAVDFDKENWRVDALAYLDTCGQLGVPASLERSRSGNGGHLWVFFADPIPAAIARRLGAFILTETMDGRPDIGLDSYDRFFPNQDTLPRGGFGNLISLPLQKAPRQDNNSVFLEPDGVAPVPDQWAFLSQIERMSRQDVEQVVRNGEGRGRIMAVRTAPTEDDDDEPWLQPPSRNTEAKGVTGPFPERLELTLADQVYVPKDELSPSLRNRIIHLAAFQNPEFYKAQAMRLPTYGKPRIISCAEDCPKHIALPRGCLGELKQLLRDLKIKYRTNDKRNKGTPIDVTFHGELRLYQELAGKAMLAHDTGVLAATTAFGKTVLAAWLIAQRGVNTLVLVHRKQLLDQWIERLSEFLGLSPKEIGRFGGGRKKTTGRIDITMIQSLIRKGKVNDLVGEYGHLVVDECHHVSAYSFEQVARRSKAKCVTGLSATVTRKDGHHPIIFMQCGPVRHRVSATEQAQRRSFSYSVYVRPTGFIPLQFEAGKDARIQYQQLIAELVQDDRRNRMICDDVVCAVSEGRSPIVLTERRDHLDILERILEPEVDRLVVLRGGMGKKASVEAYEQLEDEEGSRVLLATGRYIGEGFDDPRLDTLFLTLPLSWRGTIAQYAGRLHRHHEAKQEVRIYDYADLDVPMLERMFDRRCRGYEDIGYEILLPASAVPGWPCDVPLPVDPQWKQDYAASVHRLIRDGIDSPLANLFVAAAREFPSTVEGADRARSSSEAFLFQRLQTLDATRDRFQLNVRLPIPFDDRSQMEVDFLAGDCRLVIELDGDQHLADANAYRRDRRKDARLQEHGYFVLRFLAQDLSKDLNHVLDTIIRTLEHLGQR
mgnify:CR=1 FL=1